MDFTQRIDAQLATLRAEHRYRELFRSPEESFVHNDYLNLSKHPAIRAAGLEALNAGAHGSRGSRLLGGNHSAFEEAERAIAQFFRAPAALFFSTGYLANLAVVGALGGLADVVLSDEKNHASLIDGVILSRKPKRVVRHGNWAQAEAQGVALLVTEALFSMDGDFADWNGIKTLQERTGGFLILDEAHSAGVFPEDGRGFARKHFDWDRMCQVVTFGKAFGVSGAAVIGSQKVRDLLINTARPFIFSTATSPVIPAMVTASLKVVGEAEAQRKDLWERAEWVHSQLRQVTTDAEWGPRSPIIPWRVPGEARALAFAESFRKSGFDVRAVRFPTVPKGDERVRISLNLGTSREATRGLVEEMRRHESDLRNRN